MLVLTLGDIPLTLQHHLAHRRWVDDSLARERLTREGRWSVAIAVGNLNFVDKVKSELGFKAAHREVIDGGGTYALREHSEG